MPIARLWLVFLVLLCTALACGDDSEPAEGGAVCPDSLDGDATWTHEGDDDQCDALAAALTAQGDDDQDDDDDACAEMLAAFVLESDGTECRAELVASCDSGDLSITCAVSTNGKADCEAVIESPELKAGSCKLDLRIR